MKGQLVLPLIEMPSTILTSLLSARQRITRASIGIKHFDPLSPSVISEIKIIMCRHRLILFYCHKKLCTKETSQYALCTNHVNLLN